VLVDVSRKCLPGVLKALHAEAVITLQQDHYDPDDC